MDDEQRRPVAITTDDPLEWLAQPAPTPTG